MPLFHLLNRALWGGGARESLLIIYLRSMGYVQGTSQKDKSLCTWAAAICQEIVLVFANPNFCHTKMPFQFRPNSWKTVSFMDSYLTSYMLKCNFFLLPCSEQWPAVKQTTCFLGTASQVRESPTSTHPEKTQSNRNPQKRGRHGNYY